LDRELRILPSHLGIAFETRRKLGENLQEKDLDDYDAVYLALGLGKNLEAGIPGDSGPGVIKGLDYLEQVNSGDAPETRGEVIIVGGGRAAVDSARTARRLGACPTLLVVGREKDMTADPADIDALKEEGVELLPLTKPARVTVEGRRLVGVTCLRMEPPKGGSASTQARDLLPVHGSEFDLPADMVIDATGETADLGWMHWELERKGDKIVTDRWGGTSVPKVFAGGDIATGRGTVAHALGEGRRGAQAITAYLRGETGVLDNPREPVVTATKMNFEYCDPSPRLLLPEASPQERIAGFDEVFQTPSKAASQTETERCLRCGVMPVYDPALCRGCTNCSSRCPSHAISLQELETPYVVKIEVENDIKDEAGEICSRANINPESIVCICTSTRAQEIAAAIVKGARKPEDISRTTGARTGCAVLCIEPIFRLLQAAGLPLGDPLQSDVWYPTVPNIWDLGEDVIEKYEDRGFRFKEDKIFFRELAGKR
jgi:thioredoxin reductase/bacterioferritin-associated ferredoxin